jgi:hypothetical protein
MIPLKGFTPDAPPTTPGILIECSNFIPYESGMKAGPGLQSKSASLGAVARGAATLTQLSGSRRVFAGTSAALYELSGTSWTDRSRGAGYSLGAETEWSFTQFGDTSVAANLDTTIQTSNSGAFADQATAPKAKIVESVLSSGGGFVFAFNTIDATYGTSGDRWWCCALNDVTNWTPSVSSQCTTGRLIGGSGPIIAAKALGSDRIVAYKSNSMYVGTYVGPPTVWSWEEIPLYGCAGINAVIDIGTIHFIVGQDNLYIFDGARPIPIGERKIRTWFNLVCSGTYRYKTKVRYNKSTDSVWIFYPTVGSSTGACDRCIVYHMKTEQWGKADRTIEQAFIYNSPGETFDGSSGTTFNNDTGVFDQIPPGAEVIAIFDSSHALYSLDGTPGSSNFSLHYIGNDNVVTSLTQVTLQYIDSPDTAAVQGFTTSAIGTTVTSSSSNSAYDVPGSGKNIFQLRQTARWHQLYFAFSGITSVVAYDVPLKTAGVR